MIPIIFHVDIKTIRKAFVLIDEDVPSDEDIKTTLASTKITFSLNDDPDIKQAELGFVLMAIAEAFKK